MENDTDDVKASSINFDYISLATCIKMISMYYTVIGHTKNSLKQKKLIFREREKVYFYVMSYYIALYYINI